eukprot:Amastigsp_a341442_128.p3 type:complete len:194 gc:universal Amastigsp_a341442_128:1493-912(-)
MLRHRVLAAAVRRHAAIRRVSVAAASAPFERTQGERIVLKDGKERRAYFYEVSHQGWLFQMGTRHRSIATAYRDVRFLNFFFKRLVPNDIILQSEFSYVSPCGVELNFVRPDELPIVFFELDRATQELVFGGSLRTPFDPRALRATANGRLLHPSPICGWGLIRDALVVQMDIDYEAMSITWNGSRFLIPTAS